MRDLNAVTADIVDAAVNIHKRVGPGLFESVYEVLLANDLTHRGRVVKRQVIVPLIVDGIDFEQAFSRGLDRRQLCCS